MPGLLAILGLGQFGRNSHPIHPVTVHLPITFLISTSILDLITWAGLNSPSLLEPLVRLTVDSHPSTHLDTITLVKYLSLFSYISTVAAILTSIPTLATGLAEGYAMISAQGLDLSNPKIRTTALHALLNDLAICGAVYNWLSKRGRAGFVMDGSNAVVSAVNLGGVIYSAYLGGSLVYKYGVGVQRQGTGKDIKEKVLHEKENEGKLEGITKGRVGGKKEL